MNYKQIAEIISRSKKTTPATVYLQGQFEEVDFNGQGFQVFGNGSFRILIGDYSAIEKWIDIHSEQIEGCYCDIRARYSALPLLDLRKVEARIEPGAVIREGARIGKDCIIMMGAVINIGAEIGDRTMIDMNAVIGARAIVGKDCHIGAGAVLAGVLEPPSKEPVKIEDHAFIGANAVVLEGVNVGKGSIVAAGAVVLDNVPTETVVAGVPAKAIKKVEEITQKDKVSILECLRHR